MTPTSNAPTNSSPAILDIIGWLFGLVALAIGVINTFWGNDPGFGVFVMLLAFVFFPPVDNFIKGKTGFAVPRIAKWLLGFFILWASVGVGELFDKIDLMMASF
ncbi:hypothetical protein I2I05_07565 [Hymenobacter sp. BT683]|uniref:AI-2E family transporter n=1 Tax=Hymenobacter jeongseonensis TaxID=2791027 RepID=A0ABS0IGG1_9BACT|nr:hypothetical protein [Hymenobacter jeongseonensis]MBF9237252.1 hypothetical protein [Hymenobacter jeongseonensis]